MESDILCRTGLIGRNGEVITLKAALDKVIEGTGSTYLVSGEAGIGKTRLISEVMALAERNGAMLLRGWCLPESLESLMPVKEALRSSGMQDLVAGTPPPKLLSAYLLNDAGMLISRAERVKSDMDADIFAAMLKAVSSFVGDSLRMMGKGGDSGEFSSISHGDYRILVQSKGGYSLAAVAEGAENEFLIDDMRKVLSDVVPNLDPETIDVSEYGWVENRLSKFVTSPKYAGEFVMDDPRLRQENLFDNVLMGLQRVSATRPIVMFLDDLQWADPSTLNMLHYLSRNTRGNSILILGTFRPEDMIQRSDGAPHILETALQDMSRESLFRNIRLVRLGKDDTANVVAGALGNMDLPDELCKRIHDETEGNPFFVLEVLRLLIDERFIVKVGGSWKIERPLTELNLPSKILDVVQRRLNRLLKDQYEILECASVVGERFGSDVVGLTMGANRISLLKNLNEIEKVHKLIHADESKYRFDHCKIRDVLYGSIGDELRLEYHRMVAQSYEQLFKGREMEIAGDIAYHFLEAGDNRASGYLVMAGDKAMMAYANGEAMRFYNLALGHVTEYKERGRILECLGDLYTITGECDWAVQMIENAIGISGDANRKAELFGKLSMALERHSEYDRGIEAAQSGLDILAEGDYPAKCRLLGAISLNYVKKGEYDIALEFQVQKLEGAMRLDEKKEIADAHRLMGIIWWFRGNFEKALEHYQMALVIQRKIGDDRGKESTLNNIGVVYMETGRLNEAIEYFMEGLEYEEMVGDKSGMASAIDNIGNALHTKGDAEKALEYHLRGLELYRMTGDRNGVAWAMSSLGYVYPDLEQVHKGIQCFLESVEICRDIGDQHILVYNYYGLADLHAEIGELEKAAKYADMALALSRELGAKREEGAATYVLGIIQRERREYEDAMKTFDSARSILVDVGDTYLGSLIDYDAGLCMKASGDAAGAMELLGKARAYFEMMGMGLWLKRANQALAELDDIKSG